MARIWSGCEEDPFESIDRDQRSTPGSVVTTLRTAAENPRQRREDGEMRLGIPSSLVPKLTIDRR